MENLLCHSLPDVHNIILLDGDAISSKVNLCLSGSVLQASFRVQIVTSHSTILLTLCQCLLITMQADSAASLKSQPRHTKIDEIQDEIQMQQRK